MPNNAKLIVKFILALPSPAFLVIPTAHYRHKLPAVFPLRSWSILRTRNSRARAGKERAARQRARMTQNGELAVTHVVERDSAASPTILCAGYLTKRTSNMVRWKRRWWELHENGLLLYFASEKRLKLLGEVDIVRSCYDVRLGAERCLVSFPRLVSQDCCFAFAIVKRTYYVFAPTAAEARRWTQHIANTSASLSRRQLLTQSPPRALSPTSALSGPGPKRSRPRSTTNAALSPLQLDEASLPGAHLRSVALQGQCGPPPSSLQLSRASPRTPAWKMDGLLSQRDSEVSMLSATSRSLSQTASYLSQLEREEDCGLGWPLTLDPEAQTGHTHPRHDLCTGELEAEEETGRSSSLAPHRVSIAVPLGQEFQRLQEREAEIRRRLACLEEQPPRPRSAETRWTGLGRRRPHASSAGALPHRCYGDTSQPTSAGLGSKVVARSSERVPALHSSTQTPSHHHSNGSARSGPCESSGSGPGVKPDPPGRHVRSSPPQHLPNPSLKSPTTPDKIFHTGACLQENGTLENGGNCQLTIDEEGL